MNHVANHADIVIVGAGPVGAALALGLQDLDVSVLLLEANSPEAAGHRRTLALSYGSRLLLERLGAWERLASPTPITSIEISQQGGPGRAGLSAEQADVPALGYVVGYGNLHRAFADALRAADAEIRYATPVHRVAGTQSYGAVACRHDGAEHWITARLVAVADGGAALAPVPRWRRDYEQWAVTADVSADAGHGGVAYERFTPQGPMALLPHDDGFALVWTVRQEQAERLCGLADADFLASLQEQFGDRAGTFTALEARSRFPLRFAFANPVGRRVVYLGNAAQTLHPVAGQGFNLGLRDAFELAEAIARDPRQLGSPAMLQRYRRGRRLDRLGGSLFTDGLVRLFSNDRVPLNWLRGGGLATFDAWPSAKKFLLRRMMFGAAG